MALINKKKILVGSVAVMSICGAMLAACNNSSDSDNSQQSQPALAIRDTVQPLASGEQELFTADVVDGGDGTWRLVKVQAYVEGDFTTGARGGADFEVRLSPNADLERPDAITEIVGKDLSQMDKGDLSFNTELPLDIARKDGKIDKDLATSFEAQGANSGYSDDREARSDYPNNTTFADFVDRNRNDGSSFHMYRISQDQIELRKSGSSTDTDTNGNKISTISIESRAVYQLVR